MAIFPFNMKHIIIHRVTTLLENIRYDWRSLRGTGIKSYFTFDNNNNNNHSLIHVPVTLNFAVKVRMLPSKIVWTNMQTETGANVPTDLMPKFHQLYFQLIYSNFFFLNILFNLQDIYIKHWLHFLYAFNTQFLTCHRDL